MSFFDAYDYVGYIVPGAVLLLCLMYVFPELREQFGQTKLEISEIGIFLIVAFVAGQLLHQIAHVTDGGILNRRYASETFFSKSQKLQLVSLEDRNRILQVVNKNFGIAQVCKAGFDPITDGGDDKRIWSDVIKRMYIDIRDKKLNDRIDIFNRGEGLMLALGTAFCLLILLCIVLIILSCIDWLRAITKQWLIAKQWFSERMRKWCRWMSKLASIIPKFTTTIGVANGEEAARTGLILVFLIAAAAISFNREQYFNRAYAEELFVTYLSQSDGSACKTLSAKCECAP
jgi:hypothetical protein